LDQPCAHLPRGDPAAALRRRPILLRRALRNSALIERLPHHAAGAKREGLIDEADPNVGFGVVRLDLGVFLKMGFCLGKNLRGKSLAPVWNKNEPNPCIATCCGSSARTSLNSCTAARFCPRFLHRPHPEMYSDAQAVARYKRAFISWASSCLVRRKFCSASCVWPFLKVATPRLSACSAWLCALLSGNRSCSQPMDRPAAAMFGENNGTQERNKTAGTQNREVDRKDPIFPA
jgi:hypothetical protein